MNAAWPAQSKKIAKAFTTPAVTNDVEGTEKICPSPGENALDAATLSGTGLEMGCTRSSRLAGGQEARGSGGLEV